MPMRPIVAPPSSTLATVTGRSSCRPPRSTRDRLAGPLTDVGGEIVPVGERLAVDADDAVVGAQARRSRRIAGADIADHGRASGADDDAEPIEQRIGFGQLADAAAHVERELAPVALGVGDVELDDAVAEQFVEHGDGRLLERLDRLAADGLDDVVGAKPRLGRDAAGYDVLDIRLDALHAHEVDEPESGNREQEIRAGTGREHGDPSPDGAAVEGAVRLRGIDLALALVEHLDVAAERDRRDPVFDLIGVLAAPAQQWPAESDRKPEHLEAEPARNPEMAVLVDRDQHADRDDKGQR